MKENKKQINTSIMTVEVENNDWKTAQEAKIAKKSSTRSERLFKC